MASTVPVCLIRIASWESDGHRVTKICRYCPFQKECRNGCYRCGLAHFRHLSREHAPTARNPRSNHQLETGCKDIRWSAKARSRYAQMFRAWVCRCRKVHNSRCLTGSGNSLRMSCRTGYQSAIEDYSKRPLGRYRRTGRNFRTLWYCLTIVFQSEHQNPGNLWCRPGD